VRVAFPIMASQVWLDGEIVTMDDARSRARALVVRDGIIDYVGEVPEAILRAGDGAEVFHLGGRAVVPGFNDNHVHAVFMGDHALALDLGGLGAREIVDLLKERFSDPEPGMVIRAFNWDYPACPDPRKELLDEAFPRNPVVLNQFSGHAQWLNSAALRAIGIGRRGPDSRGGTVLRGPDGESTGIVRDLGDTKLSKQRSRDVYFREAMREERLDLALETFARMGITSVQDNSWYYPELLSLRRRFEEGRLSARFSAWSLGRRPRHRAAMDAAFALGVGVPDWIRPGPVKYFLDGTFSTRNACLCEPFADSGEGGTSGEGSGGKALCEEPAEPLAELCFLARRKRQGAFHIIGDRGIAIFLDAYEKALERNPGLAELRVRIEHAQLIRPSDIPRIGRLGVLVSAQPTALGSPEKDERLLGRERALRAYPYRSLLDAGVRLSFGSDIPGESGCDPIRSIGMAANREGRERITAEEALRCYTVGSAYAEFAEARKGALAPGMLADFVVLSQDITSVPPETIGDTVVEETVVGGKSVYRRLDRGPALQ
jgi:predicted amidohydrolase YtcJ